MPARFTRSVTSFEVSESTAMPSAGVAIGVGSGSAKTLQPPTWRISVNPDVPERSRAASLVAL